MSQAETLGAVTSEWRTTTEIADAIPKAGRTDRVVHVRSVYGDLTKLAKWGYVERRMTPDSWPGQHQAMWRLRA